MKRVLVFALILALFLVACEQVTSPETPASIPTAVASDGATIYAQNCSSCHGELGEGGIGPALTHLGDHSDEELIQIITGGRPEEGMPPWGNRLSQEEILAVVEYLRSFGEEGAAGHGEEPPVAAAGAATLEFALSEEGGEVVAKATLLNSQGHPVAGREVTFNLLTVLGGILPLGTAVTNGEGVAEFRYDPGEAPAIRMEAVYQPSEDQLPVEVDSSLELPGGEEIPPVEPGLYSAVPPLFAVVLLATVIGAVWLTYAWVGLQLLRIWRARRSNQEMRF